MTQLKDGGRQPGNREERSLSASTVIARWQGNGWDEPCKSRGLRTVLWAAGGEIPPADPAAWNPTAQISWGKPRSFPRSPAGFTAMALDGFATGCPLHTCLRSDSCSSGRDFAPRFLQTVPRGSALALHSCFTSIRLHRGLSPPGCWTCPAHRAADAEACGLA